MGNKVQMRLSERRGLSQKIFFPLWLNIKVQGKYNSNIQLHTEDRRKIQARQNRGRRGVRKMLEWRRLNATANNIQRVRNFHFSIVVERGAQEMGHYITLSITILVEEYALSLSVSKFQSVITITIRSESHSRFFENSFNWWLNINACFKLGIWIMRITLDLISQL